LKNIFLPAINSSHLNISGLAACIFENVATVLGLPSYCIMLENSRRRSDVIVQGRIHTGNETNLDEWEVVLNNGTLRGMFAIYISLGNCFFFSSTFLIFYFLAMLLSAQPNIFFSESMIHATLNAGYHNTEDEPQDLSSTSTITESTWFFPVVAGGGGLVLVIGKSGVVF
jgi:hypothetical protein